MNQEFRVASKIEFLRIEKVANPEEGFFIRDSEVIDAVLDGVLTYDKKVWQCRLGSIKVMEKVESKD